MTEMFDLGETYGGQITVWNLSDDDKKSKYQKTREMLLAITGPDLNDMRFYKTSEEKPYEYFIMSSITNVPDNNDLFQPNRHINVIWLRYEGIEDAFWTRINPDEIIFGGQRLAELE